MSSWVYVSEDNVRGKNQKRASLWSRVHKLYHEQQAENPNDLNERNVESLKGRWKRLNENVCKWVGAYKEAFARKKSGMSDNDIEKEAQTIYEEGGTRSKFQDFVVFKEVMCKHPKWNITKLRSQNENDDVEDEDVESLNYSTQRISSLSSYMINRNELRNREAHQTLKHDLIEHIWEKFGAHN